MKESMFTEITSEEQMDINGGEAADACRDTGLGGNGCGGIGGVIYSGIGGFVEQFNPRP